MLVFTRKIFQGDFHGEYVWSQTHAREPYADSLCHRRIIFAIAYAITGIYGVGSVLLSSVGCRPTGVLVAAPNAVCDSNVRHDTFISPFLIVVASE
jgi:hypothetical protein